MALITCPDCGKEVSENAPQCIQCGAPIATTSASRFPSGTRKWNAGKIIVLIGGGVIVGIVGWQLLMSAPAAIQYGVDGFQAQRASLMQEYARKKFLVENKSSLKKLKDNGETMKKYSFANSRNWPLISNCLLSLKDLPGESQSKMKKVGYSFHRTKILSNSDSVTSLSSNEKGQFLKILSQVPEAAAIDSCTRVRVYIKEYDTAYTTTHQLTLDLREKAQAAGMDGKSIYRLVRP
jgi:hypothetical protein